MNQVDLYLRLRRDASNILDAEKQRLPLGQIQGAVNLWKDLERQWREAGGQGCPVAPQHCAGKALCDTCAKLPTAPAPSGGVFFDGVAEQPRAALVEQLRADVTTLAGLWEDAQDMDPSDEDELLLEYLERVTLRMALYGELTGNVACPIGGCPDTAVVTCGWCAKVEEW